MNRALPARLALASFCRTKNLALASAIPSFLLFTPATFATSYTWSGNTNSQWYLTSNWSPNGIPSTNDAALINFAIPPYLASNTVYYDYTGANVTLAQLTITHSPSRYGGGTSVLSIGANALNAAPEPAFIAWFLPALLLCRRPHHTR